MMDKIITEKKISFKELENIIFKYVCDFGLNMFKTILESYDVQLMESRDKKTLRNKGKRQNSIKTIMGTLEYDRNVYATKDDDGHNAWVYLLDKELSLETIGAYSTNFIEKVADVVTENSFKQTAEIISGTCNQGISHGGAWNLVQRLGEHVRNEEIGKVRDMLSCRSSGKREIELLFEEMDGVWLRMQGKGHKNMPKQEMKVSVTYEGWHEDGKDNSRLVNKRVMASMDDSSSFHEKREAQIQSVYNADEINFRILNGDGGGWIRDPYEPDTVVQLDKFHIEREIRRRLTEKDACKLASDMYHDGRYDEMISYLDTYAASVETGEKGDNRSKNARVLQKYLSGNRTSLVPWQLQRDDYPEAPEGVVYKNMGVMENQNCTTITSRMKGRRMRWSERGADNMAKLLYTKENKELVETIGRHTDGMMRGEPIGEIIEIISASKAPKKDGKGNPYVDVVNHHMPIFDSVQTEARRVFRRMLS